MWRCTAAVRLRRTARPGEGGPGVCACTPIPGGGYGHFPLVSNRLGPALLILCFFTATASEVIPIGSHWHDQVVRFYWHDQMAIELDFLDLNCGHWSEVEAGEIPGHA